MGGCESADGEMTLYTFIWHILIVKQAASTASLEGKWKLAGRMLVFKKDVRSEVVTVVLEPKAVVDMVKNIISKYVDEYVVLARARVAFVSYMDEPWKK